MSRNRGGPGSARPGPAPPDPELLTAAYRISRWLTRGAPGRPRRTPAGYGLCFERVVCRTADGLRLVGWTVTPPRPRATVALFHDAGAGREAMLPRLGLLAGAGYRGIAFDHRAHGESDGWRTSFGYHEAWDVTAVLNLARRSWPRQPLAALGVGMGAAALCCAAVEVRRLQAVVLEDLYPDLGAALLDRARSAVCPPRVRALGPVVAWVTECRLGVRLAEVGLPRLVGGLAPAPVLVLEEGWGREALLPFLRRHLDRAGLQGAVTEAA